MKNRDLFLKLSYLAITAVFFVIDMATKIWAADRLQTGGDISIIDGFLKFSYAHNTGIAFSMLDNGGEIGRWGLSVIAVFGALLVSYFYWRTPAGEGRILGGLAFLLAGVLGNVAGRLQFGYVVDFIGVQFGTAHFPIFNVADIAIWIGAGLLILEMFVVRKKPTGDEEAVV